MMPEHTASVDTQAGVDSLGLRLGQGVVLIGVTIEGPPPIGLLHLRASEGTTLLYGLNGAGKSTILRSLTSAFAGLADPGGCRLHFRLSPRVDSDWLLGGAQLARRIRDWLDEQAAPGMERPDNDVDEGPGGALVLVVARALESSRLDQMDRVEVARSLVLGGHLTLIPTGSPARPSWEVFVGTDGSNPKVLATAKESDRAWCEVARTSSIDLTLEGDRKSVV